MSVKFLLLGGGFGGAGGGVPILFFMGARIFLKSLAVNKKLFLVHILGGGEQLLEKRR